ncbi:CTP synthase [Candidatus Uhrbacteria bacterium CG10_big_fil_rev_8_21_14_0_10_48_11]|uniref:CTP synthase n=1 Tax=Candidatus Uhrbacteria bacterium CG10_big_fil_rev_8_21_14_0_10_48_11 TaxID=1975037 RepID=A0A2M8LEH3_9BACT|nr:MAG: CTP synthase [Candidatus Uhrbacteria bacterium CG10_big_fil_rev_8_21_14_0_10_48_11]
MKYIFVVGGVMSSVGKGVSTASIAKILQSRGYKVAVVKCDMYINIDAGTIRPTEHGEVFVGEDGIEADQDLGNYERFTGITSTRANYITTGQVYQSVIERERNLGYDGEDVEVVPDIPNEIIRRINVAGKRGKADVTVIEIGGTVGEYQNILFLEAIRILKLKHPEDVALVLVSYLPIPKAVGEMKTKPTQYASRSLNSAGLQADFILCRAEKEIDAPRRKRLAIFCGIEPSAAISAPDVASIYEIPVNFEREKLSDKLLTKLKLKPKKKNMDEWRKLVAKIRRLQEPVKIGIVGKYFGTGNFTLSDSYISVIEAVRHAAWAEGRQPEISWLNAEEYEKDARKVKELNQFDGIIVPGGFGNRGVEGKIRSIKYVREQKIPYFGLCLGMQLAAVEFARDVCGIKDATSEEFDAEAKNPVIHTMLDQVQKLKDKNYGATMRLGSYPAVLSADSLSREAYSKRTIQERHRHRYEFNNKYRDRFMKKGMRLAGLSPDGELVEIIEAIDHPFFVGTQFHPEFTSRPLLPNPLFRAFIRAAKKRSTERKKVKK